MQEKIRQFTKSIFESRLFWLFLMGLLIRLILSPFGTLTLDQNTFIAWSNRLHEVGFSKFYFGTWSDYLPGYLYILDPLWRIANANAVTQALQTIIYKLPAIFADIGTAWLIYKIVSKLKDNYWAKITATLYLFNPAVIANSTVWGQVDSLTAFFSLLSFYLFNKSFLLSAIFLSVGTLVKPQMAVISLILFLMMVRDKWRVGKIGSYIFISLTTFILGFLPFSNENNLISFIIERLNVSLNQYPYTSVNAFNFWNITGGWRPDSGLNIIGGIIILVLFFSFGIRLLKNKGGQYLLMAFTYGATFLFMTRMHERHLLPIFAPLTISVSIMPYLIFPLIGFSFIYTANLYWAWNWVSNNFADAFGEGIVKILSIINVLMLGFFMIPEKLETTATNFTNSFLRSRQTSWPVTSFAGNLPTFENANISPEKIKILFITVVIFASLTRFFSLNSPQTHYFDEVYHAFTAENMLNGVTNAWEWWNPNPGGFAYEWTHPPVAKELMAFSMKFLGENSFGWRFPGALLGVGSVILIYFISKRIFKDELVGLIASAIFALDGLPLVLSRIGMNDSYILFFTLASVYSYLKKKNFWSAIFFGLALASKWSALWIIPIIFVAHFVFAERASQKRKFKLSYAFFLIIPPLIYIASYFPLFINMQIQEEYIKNTSYIGRTDVTHIVGLDMFIDTQKQMWWYHTRLKATHPYTSAWYSWPFLARPIYLYTSDEIGGTVSRIYAMGNPIIFWGGAISILLAAYFAVKYRDKKLGFVVFSYFVFFTPWALAPRIMFLYHYLPSVPFMAIAMAYILRRFKDWRIPVLILGLIVFIYFYPHFAGLRIPLQLDSSYYWFKGWR